MVATQKSFRHVPLRLVVIAVMTAQLSESIRSTAFQRHKKLDKLQYRAGAERAVVVDRASESEDRSHSPILLDRAISSANLQLVPLASDFRGDEVSGSHPD